MIYTDEHGFRFEGATIMLGEPYSVIHLTRMTTDAITAANTRLVTNAQFVQLQAILDGIVSTSIRANTNYNKRLDKLEGVFSAMHEVIGEAAL